MASGATREMYQHSLVSAQETMDQALEAKTNHEREKLGVELATFLGGLGPGYATDLLHVGAEDLLVFMEAHWQQHHAGSSLPGLDYLVASPSGLRSAISHLSTLFKRLGRGDSYDEATGVGNPCKSSLIQLYKQGYGKKLWRLGYQESSAVPLTVEKLHRLVQHLDQQFNSDGKPMIKVIIVRDLVLTLYNWISTMRSKDGGQICLLDFHDVNERQLFPNGYDINVPLPSELWIRPTHGTKTNKQSRNHQDPVHLKLNDEPQFCVLRRLWSFLQLCHRLGQPVQHYVFRPLTANRRCFKEAPLSSSSFIKMLQAHLVAMAAFNGETGHSLRRGGLQHTNATQGRLAAAVQSHIKTPRVLDGYLNEHRHYQRPGYQAGP